MKRVISLFILIVMLFSCKRPLDLSYIKTQQWVHKSGFKIGEGDVVEFDIPQPPILRLVGDTVYYRGKPRAIIVEMSRDSMFLEITSIDHKVDGEYRNVDESLR